MRNECPCIRFGSRTLPAQTAAYCVPWCTPERVVHWYPVFFLGPDVYLTFYQGATDPKSRTITTVVLIVTILVTSLAMWYIFREMDRIKPEIIYERRKARQVKLASYFGSSVGGSHIRDGSVSDLPLMSAHKLETGENPYTHEIILSQDNGPPQGPPMFSHQERGRTQMGYRQ